MFRRRNILLWLLLAGITAAQSLHAQTTYYSRATGNWNTAATWSTTGHTGVAAANPPTSTDHVQIRTDHLVTLDVASAQVVNFTILGGNPGGGLVVNGNSLLVTGNAVLNNPTALGTVDVNVGSGTLTVNGTLTMNGASNNNSRIIRLVIGTGTATVTGGMAFDANNAARKVVIFTAAGGTLTTASLPNGIFTLTTTTASTVVLNGTTSYTFKQATYGNLTVNQSAGTVSMTTGAGNYTFNGNLNVAQGTLDMTTMAVTVNGTTTIGGASTNGTLQFSTGTKTFVGLVTINSTGTWNNTGAATPAFRGGITNNGSFTAGTGVHTFNTNSQALTGTLSIPSVTVTGVTLTNNNTLTVATALAGTGGLTQSSGATLNIGGTATITTLTATASPNLVNYNGTAAQTLLAVNYNNLRISNTAAAVAANADFNVAGTLTVDANAILAPAAAVVINSAAAAGAITGSGTVRVSRIAVTADYVNQYKFTTNTLTNMTVEYSGAGAQTVNNTVGAYGGLITSGSGTKSLQGAIVVNSSVTLTAGTLDVTASNYAITAGGNWTNNGGTFTARAGTVTLNGTAAQTIGGSAATSFNNLTISNSTAAVAANTNFNVAGTMTVNANAILAPAAAVVINTAAAAGTITGSGTVRVSRIAATADYLNQYKFTTNTLTNLTVEYSGVGAQTVNSTVGNYGGLTIGGSGTKSLQGAVVVAGDVTLNAGALDVTAGNFALSVGGNWSNNGGTFTPQNGLVTFNGSGAQSITGTPSTQSFANLTISKSAGTLTVTGSTTAVSLSGAFAMNSGTFTAPTSMTVAGAVTLSGGTWNAGSTTNVAGNWTNNTGATFNSGDGTVVMNGGSAQTIGGTQSTTFRSLTISNSAGVGLSNTITLSKNPPSGGNLTINTGTLSDNGYQITGNDLGTVTFASGAGLTLGSPSVATLFPTNYLSYNINIASTVTYASSQPQQVLQLPPPGYGVASFAGGTKTLTGPLLARGGLSIAANTTLDDAGYQITGAAGYPMTMGANATLVLGSASTATAFPTNFLNTDITLTSPSTITYNSNQSQTISNVPTYRTLRLASTAAVTKTAAAALTADTLTVGTSNTLDGAGSVITVNGNVNNSGVISGTGSGKILLTGTTQHLLAGNGSYYKLQLNNSSNGATLTGSPTISDSLVLTSGNFTVGANTLTLNGPRLDSTETKLIAGATSSFVFGGTQDTLFLPKSISALKNLNVNMHTTDSKLNHSAPFTINDTLTLTLGSLDLFQYPSPPTRVDTVTVASTGSINIIGGRVKGGLRRWVPVNAGSQTISWPVGGADVKTQVDITLTNVTTAGWLTIRMFASDHPLINTSGISPTKSVNRYWKVRNDGIAFSSANVTLNYAGTSDVDAGANWNYFGVSVYDPIAAAWTPRSVGARTATSTEATGVTVFGDFQVGEPGVKLWSGSGDGTSWSDANNWSPTGVPTSNDAVRLRTAANISITTAAVANSVVMNNSGLTLTINAGGSLSVTSDLTDSTGTLNTMVAFPTVGGTVSLLGGTVGYTAAGAQNVSPQSYNNLALSGGGAKTFSGTTSIAGDFTIGGTATATTTGTTIVFNGTSSQAIAATTYNNLTINGSGTKSIASDTTTVGGTLTLTAGTLAVGSNTLRLNGNVTATSGLLTSQAAGTVSYNQSSAGQSVLAANYGNLTFSAFAKTLPSSGTVGIAGTFTPGAASHTVTGSTIEFNGAGAQTVPATSYNNLTISGNRGGATVTLANGGTIQVAGTFTPSATSVIFGTTGNTFVYNGSSTQTSPAFAFNNLAISNASGVTLAGVDSVYGTLTLGSNIITTGSYRVSMGPSGTVSSGGGFVNGNLQKYVSTSPGTMSFEVGVGTTYTPINSITFGTVSSAGNIIASSTSSEHPQIGSSTINATKSVNRYWTLANGSPAPAFDTYSAVFNFLAGEVDGGANTSNFIVSRYAATTWTLPTTGTKNATNTQATGITGLGDFAIGEPSAGVTKTWDGGASTNNWGDGNNWSPDGVPTSGDNVNLDGANTINVNVGASANTLTLGNSGLVLTVQSGYSLTVAGNLIMNSGTLDLQNTGSAFPSVTGTVTLNGGTISYTAAGVQNISTQSYYSLALGGSGAKTFSGTTNIAGDFTIGGTATATTTGTTIVFNGSGVQTVAATTYNNLTINGSGTKSLASGTTTVDGTLTLTTGTLSVGSSTLNINSTATATSGVLTSGSTGTVTYNQSSAGQAVLAGTYGNLTFSAYAKTLASSGTIGIAGTFTPAGSGHTVTGSTIDFNGASGSQTVPVFTYNNLAVSGSATKTFASGTITVGGNLAASGGAVTTTGSTVEFNASSGSQSIAALNYNNLTFSNAGTRVFASGSTTGIAGTLTVSGGSVTTTGSTIDFNGGAQSIPALTYNNLTLSGSGTDTLAASTTTIGGNFSLGGTAWTAPNGGTVVFTNTSGSQSIAAAQFHNLTLSGNSTKTFASGATTSLTGSLSVSGGAVTTTGSTIEFNASSGSQLLAAINYNNIIFTNAGDRTFNSGTTGIAGSFTGYANGTIDVTTNSSLIEYNGSSTQTIAPITYWQLRSNNSAGLNLNSGDPTVISILYLQSGNVTTGSNKLILNTSTAVSRTSGHIVGNLQYFVDNIGSPSRTFPIGDASNYTPVTVQFANVTTTGFLTASTTTGTHPQIGSSSIDATKNLNRYYTLTNSGIVFSAAGYTATFTFVNPGDLNGGANPSNFVAGAYNGAWTSPTMGTKTATTTQITGQLTFGDFQLGEPSPFAPKTWDGGGGDGLWNTAANWNPDGVPTSTNNVTLTAASSTTINVNTAGLANALTINSSNITLNIQSGQSLTASGAFSMSAGTLNTQNAFVSAASYSMTGGTVGYTASGDQNVSTQSYFSLNLAGSGNKTFSSTTNIAGDFTIGGTAASVTTGTTIVFNGTSSQAIAATTYNNLTINGSGTKTLAAGTTTVGGTLALTAGTLDVSTNTLALNSSVSITSGSLTSQASGTVQYNQSSDGQSVLAGSYGNLTFSNFNKTLPGSGTVSISGTFTTGSATGHTITGSTVNFNGAGAQSIPAFNYNNLTFSGNRGGAAITLVNGGTIGIAGTFNVSATNATYTITGNTISFNGSSAQLASGFTYNNLTLNNSAGLTISGNTTVNTTLTLIAGAITTGSNTVIIPSGAAVSRTNGFVTGNLQKNVATGANVSRRFEVGTGSTFAPVYITYTQVNTAGNLIVSTTAGEHPQISTSGLDQAKNVNRYWTLTNSGIVATAAGYSANFSFVPGNDKDAPATAANFIVKRYSGAWNSTSVGTRWSDSTQVLNEQNYGDFAVGEASGGTTYTWDGGAGTILWGDASNWNPNGVPTSTTNVDLSNASTININVAAQTASLTLSNGGLVLTIQSGQSLSVTGNLTIQNGTLNTEASFPTVTVGTVSITGGTFGYTGSGNQDVSTQSYYNLSLSGGGTKTMPSGTTNVAGNFTVSGVTVAPNSGTVNFNGSSSQSVAATTYYNLSMSNTGNKTFAAGTTTIANTFSVSGGATPVATAFATTIDYSGGSQTVVAMDYSTLRLSGSGTKTLAGTATVAADLDVAAGTLDLGTNTSNRTASGGTLTVASGATLKLAASSGGVSGSNFPSNFSTLALNGTVEFAGAGAQTIPAYDYANLTSSSSGARTLASSGTVGVTGTFTPGSNTYTVTGSTIDFKGSGSQTIPAFNYNNLTSSSSGARTLANSGTIRVAGVFTPGSNSYTITGSTIEFNSGNSQTIPAFNYNNLTSSSTGARTLASSGTIGVAGTFTPGTNSYTITGSTIDYNGTGSQAVPARAYNNLAFSNSGSKTVDAGTVSIAGSMTLSGGAVDATTNATTFDFNGSGSQSIGSFAFRNLTISNSGTKTLTGSVTLTGDLTVSGGTLDLASYTANRTSAGGTLSVSNGASLRIGGTGTLPANYATNTFGATSTVEYYGAAQNIGTGVTYGNLTVSGTGAKTSAANVTVAGNLTLNQNILQTSGALTMTSTVATNVTGTGEVQGAIRRFHDFTAGQNYRFNRADVYIGTATTSGTDITLSMLPTTDPTSPATTKYVQRKYSLTPAVAGNLQTIQLYYAAGEPQGGVTESKLGLRGYNGSTWSKINYAGQTRTSGSNLVTYSGLNNSLAGIQELGLYGINFVSSAPNANLSMDGGWDENAQPDANDDALVAHTGVVTGATAVNVGTLTINAGSDLSTSGAGALAVATSTAINGTMNVTTTNTNLGAITIGSGAQLTVNSGRTLSGTSMTNNSSVASTFTGNVSISSLVNNGAGTLNFDGSNSTITGAVSNGAGATISVAGTLSMMTSSALTLTSNGNITLDGASAVLNVGASGIASNLTMSGTSTLTLNNASAQLNVFGNLTLGSTMTLSNIGTINVGE
jgi:hypothetical protein